MYIDAMQDVYSHVTKVMVDTHGGTNLIQLPLDKLTQAAAANAAAPRRRPATTPSTPAPPRRRHRHAVGLRAADARSRDNARGRDRDSR